MIEDIWITVLIYGLIVFAFLIILFFMRLEAKDTTINPAQIGALVDKTKKLGRIIPFVKNYSSILGLVLIIAGVLLWIPLILQGFINYNPIPLTEDVNVSLAYINTEEDVNASLAYIKTEDWTVSHAYLDFSILFQTIAGLLMLVFGGTILYNRFNRGKKDGSIY